jgi:RNA recognition motif-containing protein
LILFYKKNDLKKKKYFFTLDVSGGLIGGSNWLIAKKTKQQVQWCRVVWSRRSLSAKMAMQKRANLRLPPEINRVLYVRNLPYKITAEEMYDIFGKYGAIRQIRVGNTPDTRG